MWISDRLFGRLRLIDIEQRSFKTKEMGTPAINMKENSKNTK